ncbi:MAG: hypothetical protein IKD08_00340 [Alphaproteobacteria bacterium]|nr:hypothetical protein [Alphaproteobacteria bacterium]
MTNVLETEDFYDIVENPDGELLFCIKARQGGPERPKILYGGAEHALFYRSNDQTVVLDYVHPEVRESLRKVKSVLIVEFHGEAIIREYNVPVRQVAQLPIPEDLTSIEDLNNLEDI